MAHRFYTLDVFTGERFNGNPLAVVIDADGLNTTQMQRVARGFNLSETVFVAKPDSAAHTASIRIFTPGRELPFAGHPTVGTACLLADLQRTDLARQSDAILVLEEGVGPVRVGVRFTPDKAAFAEFDVPRIPTPTGATPSNEALAAALGLAPDDIGYRNHQPLTLSAGVPYTFVPVPSLDILARAQIVAPTWTDVFDDEETGDPYLYCRQSENATADFRARMFAPTHGITEDPATGSAAAAFSGVIAKFDNLADGQHRLLIEQGVEMGRPSHIFLEMDFRANELVGARIGGHAVRISQGAIEI